MLTVGRCRFSPAIVWSISQSIARRPRVRRENDSQCLIWRRSAVAHFFLGILVLIRFKFGVDECARESWGVVGVDQEVLVLFVSASAVGERGLLRCQRVCNVLVSVRRAGVKWLCPFCVCCIQAILSRYLLSSQFFAVPPHGHCAES